MFVQFKMCTTSCPKQGMLNNIHYSFAFPLYGQCIFWGENKKKKQKQDFLFISTFFSFKELKIGGTCP